MVALDPTWVDRTGNPTYALQVLDGAAKPQFGWAGAPSQAPISSYAQTMLFNDHTVTGVIKTPAADDVALLFVRSSTANQVVLLAYNNARWVIATSTGSYPQVMSNLVVRETSLSVVSYADQDSITFTARGNVYIVSRNGAEVMRWIDTAGVYAATVDASHHQVAIGYLWNTGGSGGWDNWTADDLFVWPSPVGTAGSGALSATAAAIPSVARAAALAGSGTLSAAAYPLGKATPALSGSGALSATATIYVPPLVIVGTPTISNGAGGGTGTVALPTHAIGDLIILFIHNANAGIPGKPTAGGTVPNWNIIDSGAATASSATASFVATANNHTSGSWSNSVSMAAVVLRGQNASPIGGHGGTSTGQSTAVVATPAVTLSNTSGSSVLLYFFGVYSANADWGAAPAGYTKLASVFTNGTYSACVDKKDVTTTDGVLSQPIGNNHGAYGRGHIVEVLSL